MVEQIQLTCYMFADKWPSGVTVWRTYWSWGRRSRDSASWTLEGHPHWSSEHEQKIIWRIGVITTILKHNRSLGVIPSSGLNKETQPIFSQLRHETLASEWILTWSMCSLLFSLKFHRQHTTCETMVVNKWHTHTHRTVTDFESACGRGWPTQTAGEHLLWLQSTPWL